MVLVGSPVGKRCLSQGTGPSQGRDPDISIFMFHRVLMYEINRVIGMFFFLLVFN
jgi:hypothetical protein